MQMLCTQVFSAAARMPTVMCHSCLGTRDVVVCQLYIAPVHSLRMLVYYSMLCLVCFMYVNKEGIVVIT